MLCIKMELETNRLLAAVWQPSIMHSGTHGARIISGFLSHGFSKVHEHIPTTSAGGGMEDAIRHLMKHNSKQCMLCTC